MKLTVLIILNIVLVNCYSYCQPSEEYLEANDDSISLVQIVTDSLFNSHQRINLLTIDKEDLNSYRFEFAYQTSELKKTSQIAESRNAIAAINGSFFDMDKGGSVSYFEVNDSVISRTRSTGLKWVELFKMSFWYLFSLSI